MKKFNFEKKEESGDVHSVQGPLPLKIKVREADLTFVLHHVFD